MARRKVSSACFGAGCVRSPGSSAATTRVPHKVTTNVATIGIRGTEFTIAYTGANSIAVSTGEGMIEVCNNAGCAVVPAGSSATVSGPNTRIERSDVKPRLDPAQPPVDVQPVFSTSEQRQGNGLIQPVSAPLVSGSDYVVSYSGTKSGSAVIAGTGVGTPAIFDEFSTLQGFSYGGYDYKAGSVAGSFSMDGVIGWGKWTEGETVPTGYGSPEALKEFHYVTGKPTPTSDLVALGTISAVYQLAGFTLPTSSTGVVGSAPSGTLNVNFSGGSATSIVANVNVPIGGSTYNLNTLVGSGSGANFQHFFRWCLCQWLLCRRHASHAGLTYKFNSVVGEVQGGGRVQALMPAPVVSQSKYDSRAECPAIFSADARASPAYPLPLRRRAMQSQEQFICLLRREYVAIPALLDPVGVSALMRDHGQAASHGFDDHPAGCLVKLG